MDITLQAGYYDEYWAKHTAHLNHHEIVRLSRVIAGLAEIWLQTDRETELRICDLGCGRGWLSAYLSNFGQVTAVDFSQEAIERAGCQYPKVAFECANVLAYSTENKFDVVVSSEVIEHIEEQARYLRVISQILRPGGFLLLTCPNECQWKAWASANQTAQLVEKWLSPQRLREMICDDFQVIQQETFYLYFSYAGLRRVANAPKVRRVLKSLGILSTVEALRCQLGAGLYQYVLAKKLS